MERSQRAQKEVGVKAQQKPDCNPPVTRQVPETTSVMTFTLFILLFIQFDIPTKVYYNSDSCKECLLGYHCFAKCIFFTFPKTKAKESAKTFLISSACAYSEA